jgi:hypothetical protein
VLRGRDFPKPPDLRFELVFRVERSSFAAVEYTKSNCRAPPCKLHSEHQKMRLGNRGSAGALKSTTAVRQGVTGHNVRYVLAFGMAGVISAFILVFLYGG